MNPLGGARKDHSPATLLAMAAGFCLLAAACAASDRPPPPAGEPPAAAPAAEPHREAAAPRPPDKSAAGAPEIYSPRRMAEIPVDPAKAPRLRGAELWTSADGGRGWVSQGPADASRGSVSFSAPREGRYAYIMAPAGQEGRGAFAPGPGTPPEGWVVVDTTPPVVEVLSPNGGELFGAHKTTVIRWIARDANMAPAGITIEASADGEAWAAVARDLPNNGNYHWDIGPLSSSKIRLRVTARDLAGNEGSDESDGTFVVDGLAPDLRITGPLSSKDLPTPIDWTGDDLGGAGLKRVTLYVTRDNGRTWQPCGDDEDLRPPFPFKDLDGIYGLRLVAEDRVGNSNPTPTPGSAPQFVVVVDRTKPEVRLISPAEGGYLAGVPVDVRWIARDNIEMPQNPISLSYSDDGGRTWKEAARGLKNDGYYSWTPPKSPGTDCRFKVTAIDLAGNMGEAVSGRFGVDAAVPEAAATGPDRSNSNSVPIVYEIRRRGTAPVSRVRLYYRPDGAREWLEYGDDPDCESPFQFAKAEGRYGIYVVCSTESGLKGGLAQKAPGPGDAPQLVLTIDSTPPILKLETMDGGGFFMAGSVATIAWKVVESNPDPAGLTIHHTPDGGFNWNVVADGVDPTKGSYSWVVPKAAGSRHRLRLSAADKFGNRGQVESERPFTIDDDPPTVMVIEKPPEFLRSPMVSVGYRAWDITSGIDRVSLYGKQLGRDGRYRLLHESRNPQGTIEGDVPKEGTWGFILVAVDGAGFVSGDVDKDPKPEFTCALDFTRPAVALKKGTLPRGTLTYLNPAWEVEWKAEDAVVPSDRLAIRIEYSSDGGKTWFVAVPRHPNTGRADMRAHLVPGKKYRIRVVAVDPAGNEGEDVSEDFDPGDAPPASLALRGIDEGKAYPAGGQVTVAWASTDPSIRTAALELSRDGGATWTRLSDVRAPSLNFPIPDKEGRYHVRVAALDSLKRPLISNHVSFVVVPAAERVRIAVGREAEPSGHVRVLVEPAAALVSARAARLEIFDGKEWVKIRDVGSGDVSFTAPGSSGEYAVRLVVTAADGRESASNEARFRVAPVGAGAGIRLLNFQDGGCFAGGKMQVIMVASPVGLSETRVEISDAGGREGSWREIPREQLRIVKDIFQWRVPAVTGTSYRLRVGYRERSGRWIWDQSRKDFAVDSRAPAASVTGPGGECAAPVRLEMRLEPSLSPIRQLVLYVSRDGGNSWVQHGAFDASGVNFHPSAPGDYGLYLVARSEVGLQGEPPAAGTPPQATVRVVKVADRPAPAGSLALERRMPEVVAGGARVEISWTSAAEEKVQVLLEVNGERTPIARDQPPKGTCAWEAPKVDRKGCRIVLEQGPRRAASTPFDIDSSPPQIQDADVELPRK